MKVKNLLLLPLLALGLSVQTVNADFASVSISYVDDHRQGNFRDRDHRKYSDNYKYGHHYRQDYKPDHKRGWKHYRWYRRHHDFGYYQPRFQGRQYFGHHLGSYYWHQPRRHVHDRYCHH